MSQAPQLMTKASTWDIVCSANQQLTAMDVPLTINQYMPGRYEVIRLNSKGVTTGRRYGQPMDEETVKAFIYQTIYAR